jgi:hypothetical protein
MLAGGSADELSCWELSRDCPTVVGDRAGVGIAAMGVPESTCGNRESTEFGPVELRMAARRCCNVFIPVLDEVELLASGALWRCLLDGEDDDPVPKPIGGLPPFG